MRYGIIWLIVFICLTIAFGYAFDDVVHRDVTYAVAVASGLSEPDAFLVAMAAYSVDQDDDTTAFKMSLLWKEVKDKSKPFSELPHVRSNQLFHAAGSDETRQIVERAHVQRLEQIRQKDTPDAGPQIHLRRLLYLGEYLHFLTDKVVHGQDAFLGHLPEGAFPDQADLHPQDLRLAIKLMRQQMQRFQSDETLAPTPPISHLKTPNLLDFNPDKNQFLEDIAGAVVASASNVHGLVPKGARDTLASLPYIPSLWSKERLQQATLAINAVIEQHHYLPADFPKQAFDLDNDGDTVMFGNVNQLDVLPFLTVANNPVLVNERIQATKRSIVRAIGGGTETLAKTGIEISQNEINQLKQEAAWQPLSGPGGVALDPGLVMPEGIGDPQQIIFDGEAIVLVTSTGNYPFRNLDPFSFTTIARTVAAGEVPFITIGSLPSDRPGFARITYAPSLIGTAEGEALYHADVTFKAIFAHVPFGPDYIFNQPGSDLVKSLPALVGYNRLWITSQDVVLKLQGGKLTSAQHGMRILSETRLRNQSVADPEMEQYAEMLTAEWDFLAAQWWPFRMVQDLAQATAVVCWARAEGVTIDPFIFTIPSRPGYTPSYAPLVASISEKQRGASVTGGVALIPEGKATVGGRLFLQHLRRELAEGQWVTALILPTTFLLALGFAGSISIWAIARSKIIPGWRFRQAIRVWVLACLTNLLLVLLVQPFTANVGLLGSFDVDLLACFVTIIAFPYVLLWLLSRQTPQAGDTLRRVPGKRVLLVGVALLGPFCNASLGILAATLTATMTKPFPSKALFTALSYELAPRETFYQGFQTREKFTDITTGVTMPFLPMPYSLVAAQEPAFENWSRVTKDAPQLIATDIHKEVTMPIEVLKRFTWPAEVGAPDTVSYYSQDGIPPAALLSGEVITTVPSSDE